MTPPKLTGHDVSDAQGAEWKADPADAFTFVKATEGQSYASLDRPAQVESARDANHIVGFYHFLWPAAQSGTPEVQAAWFLRNTHHRDGDLLVCDWEETKGGTASAAEAIAFLAEVRRLAPRCKVGLYVNRSMWLAAPQSLRTAATAASGFLWLAEYASAPSVPGWSFWQYADHDGDVKVDQNVVNATSVGYFRKWARELVPPSPLVAIAAGLRDQAVTLTATADRLEELAR